MSAPWLSAVALVTILFASAARAEPPPAFEIAPLVIAPADASLPEPQPGVSTNAAGDVLFTLSEKGGDAVYLRFERGFRFRLLGVGDPLGGSRVKRVVSSATSLDAFRRVLLWVALEDGRTGLYRLSPPPSAFSVSPKEGNRGEPIAFHIQGDGFTPGIEVSFGATVAGFVTVISRTEITGLVPAGQPAGVVDVTVSRPGGGRSVLKQAFEFRDPPTAGCQNLFPDHRPPAERTSSVPGAPWIGIVAAIAVQPFRARRRRRLRERGREHAPTSR